MSLFEQGRQFVLRGVRMFLALPRWKRMLSIGIASCGVAVTVYRVMKTKKQRIDFTVNVPHYTAEQVVSCNNELGECPLWDAKKQLLCWLDIDGKKYWTYDPVSTEHKSYDLPERAGSFALCEHGSALLLAFESGPSFYDVQSGKKGKPIFAFEPHLATRPNDGRCDRNGCFVFGGCIDMHLPGSGDGRLRKLSNFFRNMWIYMTTSSAIYRLNKDLTSDQLVRNIQCTNSICFALDGSSMYFTDSFVKGIKKMKYISGRSMSLDGKATLFADRFNGFADGAVVDANDNVWSANFGESKVVCYDSNGSILCCVDVPEKCVTCCVFGGKDLNTLFITTLNGKPLRFSCEPNQGNLYAVTLPDFKGVEESRFKGKCNLE
mmetsp:Transcript_47229/g.78355  ORF Transcript_47229/g.78355 Transcript_47229/m.78355 type:complete len:377 (-) Transcript_47229:70-1200(-)|eukprot:CAMPEP_0202697328 /NCGR_PEP_ID=MMETSP1385-20130828/10657_1 /ASSEMBLY_ACC=CAM_ASM_000861 /TAXON_ID=933848 /ORGANISM="Elphidium margaritaceum" /LENGTH=376 /DNA_ID=CAMNT_0049353763 /DNA_START=47 /DNA_END=1177 /DNA_ORIENTATION=-